jgi:hypothetical protein
MGRKDTICEWILWINNESLESWKLGQVIYALRHNRWATFPCQFLCCQLNFNQENTVQSTYYILHYYLSWALTFTTHGDQKISDDMIDRWTDGQTEENSCHLMCEYLSWLHVWDLLSQSSLWININSIHIHTNAVYLVVSDRKGVYPCNWISAS